MALLYKLFVSFFQVGLFSIGGGYAAMPLIQNQVVDTHAWLSLSEFADLVIIAEMTPGPIALNAASFVGIRVAGIPGALVATFGNVLPPMLIVSLLAFIYRKYREMNALKSVLGTLRPAVTALIASAGVSILLLALFGGGPRVMANVQWLEAALFAGAFLLLRVKKPNPILVMLLCGALSLAVGVL